MANKSLKDWKDSIKKEVRFVGVKPYSHNIISICLSAIDKEYGIQEVNKVIEEYNLEKLGWRKVQIGG